MQVEITPEMFADDARVINALRDRLKSEMSALITINPVIEIKQPGSLPVSEGKAKRVEGPASQGLTVVPKIDGISALHSRAAMVKFLERDERAGDIPFSGVYWPDYDLES